MEPLEAWKVQDSSKLHLMNKSLNYLIEIQGYFDIKLAANKYQDPIYVPLLEDPHREEIIMIPSSASSWICVTKSHEAI